MLVTQAADWRVIIARINQVLVEHEEQLTQLDSGVGDGDHGVAMRRGFAAADQAVGRLGAEASIQAILSAAGQGMMTSTGGAMGPLLGMMFQSMAQAAAGRDALDMAGYATLWRAAVGGVQRMGKAQAGDKTMVDALLPAVQALERAAAERLALPVAAQQAAQAARQGAEATASMVARRGRAKFLGERSLGHQDAGANTVALIFEAIAALLSQQSVLQVAEDERSLTLSRGSLSLLVEKATSCLSLRDATVGLHLRGRGVVTFSGPGGVSAELGSMRCWRQEAERVEIIFDFADGEGQALMAICFPLLQNCQIVVTPQNRLGLDQASWSWEGAANEHFFGGGERFARADQRGLRLSIWADDMGQDQEEGHTWSYFPVPFVLSTRRYAFFLSSDVRSELDLCASAADCVTVRVQEPQLAIEFLAAPDPLDLIGLYTERTGRPHAAPAWNNGVWHTCLGGQEAVLAEARRIREEHIPCSALWVYDALDTAGNVGWPICGMHHSGHYDDLPAVVEQLHGMGFKVQTYLFPYFYQDSPLFPEGDRQGYFLKRADGSTYTIPFFRAVGYRGSQRVMAGIIDFTHPEAKAWWQEGIRHNLVDVGFDGWMHDFGENVPADAMAFDGRRGSALHNVYPLLYQQAARETCDRCKPDASFYARSGYRGSQRWLTAAWTGDQVCSWAPVVGLPSAVVASLTLGLSGVAYAGPDIGGYFAEAFSLDSADYDQELWLRWTQFGALCSIMRDHLGDKPEGSVDLWTSPATVACWKKFGGLHMALSPYLGECAAEAVERGYPVMRHMVLVEPDEPRAWSRDWQYMLGNQLLAAPVLIKGAREQVVYFPEGTWVDFWHGRFYQGGAEHSAPAPLDEAPLFVREGALLPLLPGNPDTLVPAQEDGVRVAGEALALALYLPEGWPDVGTPKGQTQLVLHDGGKVMATWKIGQIEFAFEGVGDRPWEILLPALQGAWQAIVDGVATPVAAVPTECPSHLGYAGGARVRLALQAPGRVVLRQQSESVHPD